ncbi:acyltransferase family protein [Ectobacillus panaciterrae]|uniref:acyltransferase family protein n=1 Tax=Ectobacillus panaciterrae TaxID=363872 RepID=UPI0004229AA5|nr:acyltransferase family protein [Ectobacillus panaciterrae]
MAKKREVWLDAAKGLCMILVVAGHAYKQKDYITYIYWFHMPFFFLLSGYVSKPVHQWPQLRGFIRKRAKQLLVPYFIYLGSFTLLRYAWEFINGNTVPSWYGKDLWNLMIGGRFITGYYGVFWFITCLFLTQIVFAVILLLFKARWGQFAAIGFLYMAAHAEAYYVSLLKGSNPSLNLVAPWNIDVVFIAVFYYSIGYFAKPYLKRIPSWITAFCTASSAIFIFLQDRGLLDYHLSMKYLRYENVMLDAFIPLVMTVSFCGIFQLLQRTMKLSFFTFLNKKSMIIMYLHIGTNKLFLEIFDYGNMLYTIIGIAIPVLFSIFALDKKEAIYEFCMRRFAFAGNGWQASQYALTRKTMSGKNIKAG